MRSFLGIRAYHNVFRTHASQKEAAKTLILLRKNLNANNVYGIRFMNVGMRFNSTKSSSSQSQKSSQTKSSFFNRLSRAITFSASSILVLGAAGLACIVIYLVIAEIAFPSGDTQTFNRAVKLVEDDPVAAKLLRVEEGTRLKAYGETGSDKWTRNRPISSVRRVGLDGKEHVLMRFHVESKTKHGVVQLEAIDDSYFKQEFSYIALDVPGEDRHFVVGPKVPEKRFRIKDPNTGFLGVKWGPKKD
ncbi:hypothetical protein PACTADRAFT_50478 [Pachysolen tannophilus NRRL Y-2460]|uniref:Mitochondrial import inner membrane translocase subunit Tim21 n=1 Tax=Pachysolen tannophilus NRRL Y-2460 TaxID=669874 RepID=A0A1E4TS65_PACTA|nr:hypothetical protein PACTADRAFT_50478 [Pachysolen tannophilus NRRL Y-2460]